MPAPATATYSVAALVAAQTSLRNFIDAGAAAGRVRIRNSADLLLADLPLADPCGTVNVATGQLTLTMAGSGVNALLTGTAAYVEFTDSDGTVHLALPVQTGTSPVSGKAVFNTLTIVADSPVDVLSAVIG